MSTGGGGRHVVVRADASTCIGTGHVARCRTLAAALVADGWRATLVSRDLPDGLRRSVASAGLGIRDLPAHVTLDEEPGLLADWFAESPALLVVDSYAIGADWLRASRSWAPVQVAIDDLANRPLPVDLLLNQNLGAAREDYERLVLPGTRLLLGPSFALLRPEFAQVRARMRPRDGRLERVLVFMSGADADDVTRRAAEGVVAAGLSVDVVVGPAYPDVDGLRRWVSDHPLARLHVDIDGMAALMEVADLAVGAAGSASWERCTVGLPAMLVTLADNQLAGARQLAEAGAAMSLGWHTGVSADDVTRAVLSLGDDPGRLRDLAAAAAAITDGAGTQRVVEAVGRLPGVAR